LLDAALQKSAANIGWSSCALALPRPPALRAETRGVYPARGADSSGHLRIARRCSPLTRWARFFYSSHTRQCRNAKRAIAVGGVRRCCRVSQPAQCALGGARPRSVRTRGRHAQTRSRPTSTIRTDTGSSRS